MESEGRCLNWQQKAFRSRADAGAENGNEGNKVAEVKKAAVTLPT